MEIDYTKERKSKLIQVCPKCGKKGRYKLIDFKTKSFDTYIHTSVIEMGIMETIKSQCWIPKS